MTKRKVGRDRSVAAVRLAAQRVAERLEGRLLFSGAGTPTGLPAGVLAAVPTGLTAIGTGGRLELGVTPVAGRYTPDYVQLDRAPGVTATGTLAPFATAGPTGFTAAQVRHAYGVDAVTFGTVQGNGAGQTIAIIDAYDDPTAAADLHSFDQAFALPDPPSFTKVNETGGGTLPGVDPAGKGDDWEVEEALDVEWAHAMAPGANILLVEATAADDADLVTAAAGYARTVPGVVAVTMSFGRSESSAELPLDATFTTPAGHAGVTFLASTGDYGAPAEYPAYSPNVVAVGGTTLATTDAAGDYGSEAGWADGGGGISGYEPQPSYQSGVVTQSKAMRTAPDVAFDADPASGASIYDTYDFGTATPWLTVGGTSLSSPSVAGLVAVADQGRTLAGGSPLDGRSDTLPKLYGLAAAGNFHDVTAGSNGYAAGVGYDLVTGRGSPVANDLVPALAAAGPFVTASTPSGVLTSPPSSVTFTFSGAMDTASFNPAADIDALTGPGGVDDRSAVTGYAWTSPTTLQVNLALPAATGTYSLTVGPGILSANGDVPMDQNENGVPGEATDTYTASFDVDPNPLAVTATTPAAGGLLAGPAPTLSVRFNQPVSPATVSTSDLTLGRGTVTAASISPDGTTVTFTLGGLTADGPLTATVPAGAVGEVGGSPLQSPFSATYTVDLPTESLPTPFAPLLPAGSLAYAAPVVADAVYAAGDTHAYTVALAAGEQVTVVATTAAALQGTVSVLDPSGNALASAVASTPGQPVTVQSVPVVGPGTYTVVVGGAGGTAGAYALAVTLDAAAERQGAGGASHATTATAQGLDGAFTSVGGAGRRAAVTGSVQSTAPTGASTLFSDSFESGLGGFTLNNTVASGLWHLSAGRGTQSGHSATQSLYFGTGETAAGGGTYNTGARTAGYATMPAVALPAAPAATVSFDYVLQTEGNASYDKAQVQVSTDGGTTFATLASYNAVAESAVWKATTASLAAYAGKTVVLRWSFDTVDGISNNYEGWYVDDVAVTAAATANPVPAVYAFTLAAGDTASLGLKATGGATPPDLQLLDPAGNVIAQQTPTATGLDRSVADVVAPAAGTYYARVTGAVGSGYDLAVTVDATFDTAAAAGIAAAQPIGSRSVNGDQRVVGHLAANGGDTYAVTLAAGGTLSVSTATPGDTGGQPGDVLAPVLTLRNAAGTSVGPTVTTAADGRNQTLTFAAASAGTYYLSVASGNTAGDYVLAVDGAAVTAAALTVTSITPANGVPLKAAPTQVTVVFSGPVDSRGLTPSLLTVDGAAATAVTQVSATSATFTVAAVTAQGPHTIALAGGLVGLRGGQLSAYASTFTLDTVPPAVVASSVAAGATVASGPLTYTATFSEPMLAANLDPSDVTLTGKLTGVSYAGAVAFSANNTALTVTYANLPEDQYTLTLLTGAGHFEDAAGNDLAANFVVAFAADAGTRAVPTPTAAGPYGSLVYGQTVTGGAITSATDTDAFTIGLSAGQTLTVVGHATTAGLTPVATVADPTGTVLATASGGTGGSALVQTVTAAAAGTYTVTVGGATGTTGGYSVLFDLDAAVEAEAYGGPSDDTPSTAQDITASLVPIPGAPAGVTRGAVVGSLESTTAADVYAVTLTAGSTTSFTVASPGVTVRVTDAAGDVLATGTTATGPTASGSSLSATQVAGFTAPATGAYYVRVTGTTVGPYTLVATTGAAFQSDPGTLSPNPAQPIDPTDVVLAALSSPSDAGLYQFAAVAGATLTLSSLTPGPGDTLGVRVQLYGPSGTLLADNFGGAADGRNALLTDAVTATGVYQARVTAYGTGKVAASSQGEYLLTVSADKHPAAAPAAPALTAAADTGVSSADRVTRFNDATAATALQFSVPGTVAGDTVEVFIDGKLAGSAVATGATATVTATAGATLADGSHTVTARQVDPAAGESVDSTATTVTVETATPPTPAAPALAAASDSGTVGDGSTDVTTPAFAVTVSTPYFRFDVDGAQVGSSYAAGATFTVPTALTVGSHTFAVAAVDAAGNVSAVGPVATVTVVAPPAAPTGLQLDPGSDTGVSSTDGVTSSTTPTFDVTAAGPGTLHLTVDGSPTAAVTLPVPAAGTYQVPFAYPTAFAGYASSSVFVASNPLSTAVADVNGDGHADLVVGSEVQAGLAVLFGTGTGTFTNSTTLTVAGGGFVTSVAAADLNGDGHVDLIAGTSSDGVQVFWGSATGAFAAPTVLGASTAASRVVVGDFNGDGKPDLAAISGNAVDVFLNAGGNAFAAPVVLALPGTPYMLAAGDLNGDGRADLAVANQNGDNVSVVLSTGNGTFAAPATIATPNVADGVAIGDVNGDGIPDVVSLAYFGDTVTPYFGKGDGTFTAGTPAAAGPGPSDLTLADLNGDGKLDVALDNVAGGANGASYLLNTGTGTFAPRVVAATSSYSTYGISAGDFNGDGRPDLAFANFGSTSVTVLLATATGVADGTHAVTAWETDAGGDASATASTSVTLDRVPPATPAAPVLAAASDTGASQTDGITSITTPTFTVAGGGPYFRVYRNGTLVSGTYAAGTTFTSAPLADGTYTFTVVAVDAAGNASPTGPAETVTIDTQPPAVPPAPALAAASDSGVSQTDGITNVTAPTLAVTGGGPYFRVYQNGVLVSNANATGTTFALAPLADGTYTFTVAGVDTAGNVSAPGPGTTVTVDTRAYTTAAVDPTFGTNGTTLTSASGADAITGLAALPNGAGTVAVSRIGPPDQYPYAPSALAGLAEYTAGGLPVPTFGNVGLLVSTLDSSTTPAAVAVTPDGKFVVVGEVDHVYVSSASGSSWQTHGYVARYDADGSLDASFGTGGWTTVVAGPGRAVTVQPDGKILVAGSVGLERLTAAGAVDTSFGSGGIVTASSLVGLDYRGLTVLADGRIVFAGDSPVPGSSYSSRFAVGRLTTAGQFDTTFGTAGVATSPFGASNDFNELFAVSVQPDGTVLAAGWGQAEAAGVDAAVVLKFTAAGAADPTFGTAGFTTVDLGTGNAMLSALAVRADGRIVVAGTVGTTPAVAELNADGTPALAFGPDGSLQLPATPYGGSLAAMVVQADGNLVVGGSAFSTPAAAVTATELALSRVVLPFGLSSPALAPASDTGTPGDGITNVNTPTLTFAVPAGDYARVYRNGVLVSGSYLTGGTFTSAPLADGTYAFTYAVVDAAGNVSASSPAVAVTIETAQPTVTAPLFATLPAGLASVSFTFSEPVYGLTLAQLALTTGDAANFLDGTQTLTTTDHVHWTVGNLAGLDVGTGLYQLKLAPSAAVTDAAGNALAVGATASWMVATSFAATAPGRAIYLRLDPTGTVIQMWQSSTAADPTGGPPNATFKVAFGDQVAIAGNGYAGVTLTVDESNGVLPVAGLLSFDGGTGATGDAVVVRLSAGGGSVDVADTSVVIGGTGSTATDDLSMTGVASLLIDGSAAADQFDVSNPTAATPAITLATGGGADLIEVSNGGVATLAPGNTAQSTVEVFGGTLTVGSGPAGAGLSDVGLSLLRLFDTGTLRLASPAAAADRTVLVLGGLVFDTSGADQLDVGANDVIVRNSYSGTYAALAATGFAGGTWAGPGIDSSAAAADARHLTGVGVLGNDSAATGAAVYATFDGVPVVESDVLVRYTLYGDLNLDGAVNAADYSRIDTGFVTGLTGWANGDLNGDGVVDGSDYTLMDNAFNQQPAAAVTPAVDVARPAAATSAGTGAAPAVGKAAAGKADRAVAAGSTRRPTAARRTATPPPAAWSDWASPAGTTGDPGADPTDGNADFWRKHKLHGTPQAPTTGVAPLAD